MIYLEHAKPNVVKAITVAFGVASLIVAAYLPSYGETLRLFGVFLGGIGLVTVRAKELEDK